MAFCEAGECDWSEIVESERDAAILMVLHFVVKHPERYQLLTGRDQEEAKRLYAEHIERFKEKI